MLEERKDLGDQLLLHKSRQRGRDCPHATAQRGVVQIRHDHLHIGRSNDLRNAGPHLPCTYHSHHPDARHLATNSLPSSMPQYRHSCSCAHQFLRTRSRKSRRLLNHRKSTSLTRCTELNTKLQILKSSQEAPGTQNATRYSHDVPLCIRLQIQLSSQSLTNPEFRRKSQAKR